MQYKIEYGVRDTSEIYYLQHSAFAEQGLYYLQHLGLFQCSKEYRVSRDYWDSFILMFIETGQMNVTYRGIEQSATVGDIVLLDCKEPHVYGTAGDDLSFHYIHFNGAAAQEYFEAIYRMLGAVFIPSNPKAVDKAFAALHREVRSPVMNEHTVSVNIHIILGELYNSYYPLSGDNSMVQQVVEYIEQHYAQSVTLGQIAAAIRISESQLTHEFKRYTGNTPYQYLLSVRLQHARQMLITSVLSLEEIAPQCGFQSASQFIRVFKKHTGITPHKFRKIHMEFSLN